MATPHRGSFTAPHLSPRLRVSRGLVSIMRRDMVLATILQQHNIIEDAKAQDLSINGEEIRYNPEFIDGLDETQLAFVLAHQAMHIAFGHHVRMDGYAELETFEADDKRLDEHGVARIANEAGDMAVNGLLEREGWNCGGLKVASAGDAGLDAGMNMEWYYAELRKRERQKPPEPPGEGNGGGGGGEGQKPCIQPGGDGNGQGNPSPTGHVEEAPAPQEGQPAPEDKWREMMTSAMIAAKACGSEPGYFDELVELVDKPPRVNWRQKLRQFATRTIKGGVNWSRPRRSSSWRRDVIFPSNRRRTIREIMMAVDTSGSMSADECNMALHELSGITKAYRGATIRLVQCDTRIVDDRTFGPSDTAAIAALAKTTTWHGRGGTDMNPVMRLAERVKPQAVIMLTDGYMTWPEPPRGIPVLWLMTTEMTPPWGETTRLDK